MTDPRTVEQLRRALVVAERAVTARSERRRELPAGSPRSRVTTANARWATACQERDRILRAIEERKDAA